MRKSLDKVKNMIQHFDIFEISQVIHSSNKWVDALNKLASSSETPIRKSILIKEVQKINTNEELMTMVVEGVELNWMMEESKRMSPSQEVKTPSYQICPSTRRVAQKILSPAFTEVCEPNLSQLHNLRISQESM